MKEQWQELKETIIEMRDNGGTGTQHEICRFLANYMNILEKQMQEPKWIPISKYGYPKPEDEYKHFLTIDDKGEITIQEFLLSLDEEPQPYFTGMRNIIAYIPDPLPEPYKEESEKT